MSRKRGGRPPLHRDRVVFRFRLEDEALERIRHQAAATGFPLSTYMERVVCLAHDFVSPFLPETVQPLPVAVEPGQLRDRVSHLDIEDCTPARRSNSSQTMLRVDEPLGDRIYDWCDQHEIDYGSYVRSIVRLAAGYRSIDDLTPQHVQGDLLDVASYGGERARAS